MTPKQHTLLIDLKTLVEALLNDVGDVHTDLTFSLHYNATILLETAQLLEQSGTKVNKSELSEIIDLLIKVATDLLRLHSLLEDTGEK